jgi:hypothetical protein
MDLKTAHWIEPYKMYVSPNPSISALASPTVAKSPLNFDQVWVNRSTRGAGSIGNPDRDIMVKPNRGNTWLKKGSPERIPTGERYRRMTMPVNHKLTNVVKDRVVQNFQLTASELLISFVGGSTMMVKIEEFNSPPLREGARIRQISEDQVKLVIECEDGVTFDVRLVDPGSSVAVRDKSDLVEYLG